MIEIGVNQDIIEEYYKNIKNLKNLKYDIVNDINEDKVIVSEKSIEGGKIMNPLSKKDKENIAELNALLGTRYRENEFDLENTDDLIDAVENITAEYMDYMNYWARLNDIVENFDQSLEVFHPEKWFNMTKEGTTETGLIDDTILSLDTAEENMYELASEVEIKCREIWKFMLLGNNKKAQEYFVGDISKYSEEQLLDVIEGAIENILEVEYENQVQNDAENFANTIKKYLEDN